jgi:EAL domain-containing protein (putative c-di-GMP-specific phosphodiesterase class I)
MSDPLKAARIFSELKDLGVRLSIDDFGTGHSSLSRLRGFPVDVLKIDRSFISAIEHDCDSREIARLIITLAHHLNLKVIAEGIETLGQRSYLQEFGCEFGQGYLFSEPVGHAVIENMLATQVSDEVKDLVFAGSPLAAPSQIEALLHSGR